MANEKPPKAQSQAAAVATDAPPPGLDEWTRDTRFFGHPRGLSTLFFTEMWERFSYYGIRPLLVLFMTAALVDGGFGFERPVASSIAGIYAFSVYLASLPGGWIADRWLGLRRAIWWGGVFIAVGHLSIALSVVFAHRAFFLGLIFIVIGTGLLKPNISAIVGDLYPDGGARRDAGFSIFYMGINTGALIAPIVTGFLGERVGWHLGFGAAGVGMLIGLLTYRLRAPGTLGPIGLLPSAGPAEQRRVRNVSLAAVGVLALVVAMAMLGVFAINAVYLANLMLKLVLGMAVLYFAYLFVLAGLSPDEKKRIAVIMVLFVFAMIFWAAFEQAPTSLNLFARDFTDRVIFGWEVPTSWVQLVNPLFVILLAPVFAAIWVGLSKRGTDLSSPAKFGFGLFFAGLGFVVMVLAANRVISAQGALKVSLIWLVLSYLLQTCGELALSPVGLSSMTKLAPRRFVGQMMGVWFTAAALGNLIAGIVGGHVDPEKLDEMPRLFMRTSISLFISAGVIWALVVPIRKMMGEAKH
jgi:POT family proton-dependent oligopeptide transporter